MKILHVSKYYYPFVGGIEQVARDCVKALKGEHEQRVLCFNHEKGNTTDEVDGVSVTRAGCFAKVASQSLSFSYKKLLKREFKEFEPDVVIFHYPNPFAAHYLLKFLKKRPDCKLVLYWHLDITKQKILGKLFKGQNRRLCARAAYVIGATPIHLEESEYYPYFRDHCKVMPYGIDTSRLAVTPAIQEKINELRSINHGLTLCFAIGRHVPYKGMEYLIRAASHLDESYRILIAGSGPLTDKLEKMAADTLNVTLLGPLTDEEATAYRSVCDIFCFPSVTRNEAFGLALAEAMYCYKPAVTFTIPHSGVNYVSLNGVTGLEVANGDAEAFARAIERLAEDDTLRETMGQAAHDRVASLFTDEIFAENFRKLIGELL